MPNCVRGGRGDTAHRFLLCLCPAPLNTALIQRHPNQPRVLGFALVGEPSDTENVGKTWGFSERWRV